MNGWLAFPRFPGRPPWEARCPGLRHRAPLPPTSTSGLAAEWGDSQGQRGARSKAVSRADASQARLLGPSRGRPRAGPGLRRFRSTCDTDPRWWPRHVLCAEPLLGRGPGTPATPVATNRRPRPPRSPTSCAHADTRALSAVTPDASPTRSGGSGLPQGPARLSANECFSGTPAVRQPIKVESCRSCFLITCRCSFGVITAS